MNEQSSFKFNKILIQTAPFKDLNNKQINQTNLAFIVSFVFIISFGFCILQTSASLTCPPNTWQCNNSIQCINITSKCNGIIDCTDGSDESSSLCANVFTCLSFQFKCLTVDQCIRKEYLCDHGKQKFIILNMFLIN